MNELDILLLILSIYGILFFIIFAIMFPITRVGFYYMARKAGLSKKVSILSFIPFFCMIPVLDMIKEKRIMILLLFVPFVNIAFHIIWSMKLFKVFGKDEWFGILSMFVPFFTTIITYYIGFSKNEKYIETN